MRPPSHLRRPCDRADAQRSHDERPLEHPAGGERVEGGQGDNRFTTTRADEESRPVVGEQVLYHRHLVIERAEGFGHRKICCDVSRAIRAFAAS